MIFFHPVNMFKYEAGCLRGREIKDKKEERANHSSFVVFLGKAS